MSRVRARAKGLIGLERGLTFRFDVNICDNISYIPRGLHLYLFLTLSPSLSPVKIKVCNGNMKGERCFTVTEERTTQQYADDMVMSKTEDESVRGEDREQERGSNVFE